VEKLNLISGEPVSITKEQWNMHALIKGSGDKQWNITLFVVAESGSVVFAATK
jgi:hypothetical protein